MKKNSLLLAAIAFVSCLFLTVTTLFAAPVDSTMARTAATLFMQQKVGHKLPESQSKIVYIQQTTQQRNQNQNGCAFYIINFDSGFVIVSADTRVKPVIGYSTESIFRPNDIPKSLQELLEGYTLEIEQILELSEENRAMQTEWQEVLSGTMPSQSSSSVGPLLKTTWNQNYPYNILCPTDANGSGGHAYAGCVATAMAQIIRYWNYPSHGFGSHGYFSNFSNNNYGDYGYLSVNFSTAHYDYSQMPFSINNNSPQNEINEVAKLIYHCGVAVEMMYGPSGSGAYDSKAADAFTTYFGYSNAHIVRKNNYTNNEAGWISLIKQELDLLRPVYYSGNETGGHAFVCDGYDNQNFFHFNWGWSGSYNGFFSLSSLTPGSYSFTNNQMAIIGIDASQAMIVPSQTSINLYPTIGEMGDTVSISVLSTNLSQPIQATASDNFLVSNDNQTFGTTATLSQSGGTLYIYYATNDNTLTPVHSTVTLTCDDITIPISVTAFPLPAIPHAAPKNLTVTGDSVAVGKVVRNVSWQAPIPPVPTSHTISWETTSYTNMSYNSNTVYALHRYCDSDLVYFFPAQLTKISFYAKSNNNDCHIIVFKGGSYRNGVLDPGTLVVDQIVPASQIQLNKWNDITLNTPVEIELGKEIWYGIKYDNTGNKYAMGLSSSYVPEKGNIVGWDFTDYISWDFSSYSYNFTLKATAEEMLPTFSHYKLTRNNVLLDETTANSYTDTLWHSGDYQYKLDAVYDDGKTGSIDTTIHVRVYSSSDTTNANICEGSSYSFYGQQFSEAGTYQVITGQTLHVLQLTIIHVTHNVETKTACESYTWHGITHTTSGTYTYAYNNSNECPKVDTLKLTINHAKSSEFSATACDSYTWNGQTYTVSGDHHLTLTAANNCDSVVTLHLTVNHSNTGDTTVVACDNYTWIDGITYTESTDSPTYTLTNTAGCDSVVTLHLTVNHSNTGDTTVVACNSYTWIDGITYTESTDSPAYTLTNTAGCDSVVTLHLTINHSNSGDTTVVACNSYTWIDGINYTESTDSPTYTLTNTAGCDSVVTLHLTVNHSNSGDTTVVACNSYTWIDGINYTESTDSPTYTLTNTAGCDSVVTLHLTVNHSNTGGTTVVACDSYTWINGITYTESTDAPTYALTNAAGCDSIVTLHLTINHSASTDEYLTFCDNELPYHYINGQIDTTFDIETPDLSSIDYHLSTESGCDSIVTLHLTINHSTSTDEYLTICDNKLPYHYVNGQIDTTFDIETPDLLSIDYHLLTKNGCDSMVTLHLTVNHSNTGDTTVVACDSYTWIDGITYTESTDEPTYTLMNAAGCDSVVTLHLTVNHSNTGDTTVVACDSYTWIDGITYTESTDEPTYTLTNAAGCDSVVTLHLTVNHSNTGDTTVVACNSYTWIDGITYTKSTDAPTYTLTNTAGCDSVVTLHLTVNHSNTSDITVVACNSYTWIDGITYTKSTDAPTYTLTNAAGCDSVVTLHLTVNYSASADEYLTICDNELPYHYINGQIDTTFDIETPDLLSIDYHLLTKNGCDSVVTLHLTVNHPQHESISIIAYNSYIWNDVTYDTTGVYTYEHLDSNGCTQVDTLHLTVYYSSSSDIYQTSCESFSWNGETFTTSGDYEQLFRDIHGADSLVTLHLTVNYGTHNQETDVACNMYEWNGVTYTETKTYTYEYMNAVNCPSVDTLHLTVNHSTYSDTTVVACVSYTWNDSTYTESGTYTFSTVNAVNCDSVATLHLTVNHPTYSDTTVVACVSYTWNDSTYTESGTYMFSTVNAVNCDSVATLNLTVNHSTYSDTTVIACVSYTWNDSTYTESGTYTFSTVNAVNCDSVATLNLTINHPTYSDTTVVACVSYTWNDSTYTESGTYTFSTVNAVNCDSVATLHLTVNHPTYSDTTVVACVSYTWNDSTYTESGTYTFSTVNAVNCDSVATLNLTINHPTYSDTTVVACVSYTWNDSTYTESGTYTFSTVNAVNCDSVATLHLTINHPTYSDTTVVACVSYIWNDSTYTESGTYTFSTVNAVNCDSVATLHLTINHPTYSDTTVIACDSYTWNDNTYTESGTYTFSTVNAVNCDSVATLNLTINYPTYSNTTVVACVSYTWNDSTYTESGTYTFSTVNAVNCDSVATLNLTINHPTYSDTTVVACVSYTWNDNTYTESGTYTFSTVNAVNCDSVATLNLTINHPTYSDTTVIACDSYTWNDNTYTESGTYTFSTVNAVNCDSVATLNLTINHPTYSDTSVVVCDSYTWNDSTYTESGTYTFSTVNAVNCDSVATLHLTVNHPTYSDTTVIACDSYTWNDNTYTESGTYTFSTVNAVNCDSVATLHLTINHPTYSDTTVIACDSYTWNDSTYTESGTYTFSTVNAVNCDSVATLNLTINHSASVDEYLTICDNELPYHYINGEIDTTFDIGTPELLSINYYLSTVSGCDSIVTLHLTVYPSYNIIIYDTAIREQEFTFEDFTVTPTDSGTYTYDFPHSTVEGCDSIVHLNLYVQYNDGIESHDLSDVDVYPNPAQDLLFIKGEDMSKIMIFKADGQLVYVSNELYELNTVDVSRYASGQYFVKIIFGNKQTITKKVIVSRK